VGIDQLERVGQLAIASSLTARRRAHELVIVLLSGGASKVTRP
jgi:hypothetical protein